MTLKLLTNDGSKMKWTWKRVVPRVDDGYCLQQQIHSPVRLRADELHLNSLGRAQRYISFIFLHFFLILYFAALYYNSGCREPQCATVRAFGLASMCTAAKQACDYYLLGAKHVINQM